MAYYFDNATLLGYSFQKKYGSENNDFSLHAVKNISLEGFLDYKGINKEALGVKNYFNDINNIISLSSGEAEAVNINGYFLGSGRITNVYFDKEKPILYGRYKYDIEIFDKSDLSGLAGNYYGNFIPTINESIASLDENFTFNYINNKYNYNHELNIKLNRIAASEDLISKTKTLASGILNDTINLGLLGEYSGFYNILKNKKHVLSERYDLIENQFGFTKSIEIDKNFSGDYSTIIKHTISNDGMGKSYIQENGIINFLENNLTDLQKENIFKNEISNCYNRCSGLFDSYSLKYNVGTQYNSLNNKPQSISRKDNVFDNIIEYSAAYVNDITYFGGYFLNYEINNRTSIIGEIETVENGEIYIIGETGNISIPNNILNQRKAFYPRVKSYSLGYTILHTGTNYDNLFKYSITSTNNICYNPNDEITYLSISTDQDIPTEIITEFLFPKKLFKINSNQRRLGQFTTNIKAVIPSGKASDANLLFSRIVYPLSSSSAYISRATHSYDSDGNVSAQIEQVI